MSHTILLIQTSQAPSSKTYIECASVAVAMDELIAMYEEILKSKYPHKERIEFDVNDVLEMVYNLPDCAALVQKNGDALQTTDWRKIKRRRQYVIPGLIAVFACLFFLLVGKYGLRGSKPAIREVRPGSINVDNLIKELRQEGQAPAAPPPPLAPNGEAESSSGAGPGASEVDLAKRTEEAVRQVIEALSKENPAIAEAVAATNEKKAAEAMAAAAAAAAAAADRNSVEGDLGDEDTEEIVIGGGAEAEKVEEVKVQ
ncbi:hypothetical protein DFQ27_005252 [Actinomortierella ambigua]|uniref:Uncharacterized protein n=1 Tax=Actinomortierella ambigua TaxID=1343610 RepID=A0A9P6PZD9_9FUNG|nr:hypothetical protein DFQ27_005252 [Actinomortierella ambigua]